MPVEDILDIDAIDGLLDRFRLRKLEGKRLEARTSSWDAEEPAVLSPELLAAARLRFEHLVERMASDLSAILRSRVAVSVQSFEQLRLGRIVQAMPHPGLAFVLRIQELDRPAYLLTDDPTVTSFVDLLVGGQGTTSRLDRGLTAIETRVARDLLDPIVRAHQTVLSTITPLTFTWTTTHARADELKPFPVADAYLQARYRVVVRDELEWSFVFALPVADLVPAIETVARLPMQSEEAATVRRETLQTTLGEVKVGLVVELGSAELSLGDVSALDVGDVIVLDRRHGESFALAIEGIDKYRGRLGRNGRSLAFEVTEIAGPEGRAKEDRKA